LKESNYKSITSLPQNVNGQKTIVGRANWLVKIKLRKVVKINRKENLVSLGDRTKEERESIGRMGGIASGESKREVKKLKEELITLLEEGDIGKKISVALIKKAEEGNIRAFEVIRDTVER
jgi:alcohol dehydrogenase class IV